MDPRGKAAEAWSWPFISNYCHFPIRLHGVALDELSTENLILFNFTLYHAFLLGFFLLFLSFFFFYIIPFFWRLFPPTFPSFSLRLLLSCLWMAVPKGLSVRLWLFDLDSWVQALVTSCEIHCGRNDTSSFFSKSCFQFPPSTVAPYSTAARGVRLPWSGSTLSRPGSLKRWLLLLGWLQRNEVTLFHKAVAVQSLPLQYQHLDRLAFLLRLVALFRDVLVHRFSVHILFICLSCGSPWNGKWCSKCQHGGFAIYFKPAVSLTEWRTQEVAEA